MKRKEIYVISIDNFQTNGTVILLSYGAELEKDVIHGAPKPAKITRVLHEYDLAKKEQRN